MDNTNNYNYSLLHVLNRLKQQPDYEIMHEYGKLLMINVTDFTKEQKERFAEIEQIIYHHFKTP